MKVASTADLILMLDGAKRETSRIEFGAHQVVIVRSDEAKKKLPDEFGVDRDWVMTVSSNDCTAVVVGTPCVLIVLLHASGSRKQRSGI